MRPTSGSTQVCTVLSSDAVDQIDALARAESMTRSTWLRRAIVNAVRAATKT